MKKIEGDSWEHGWEHKGWELWRGGIGWQATPPYRAPGEAASFVRFAAAVAYVKAKTDLDDKEEQVRRAFAARTRARRALTEAKAKGRF